MSLSLNCHKKKRVSSHLSSMKKGVFLYDVHVQKDIDQTVRANRVLSFQLVVGRIRNTKKERELEGKGVGRVCPLS